MTNKATSLEEKKKAIKRIESWASAGEDAFRLAEEVEAGKISGEIVPATTKNINITIRGAIKQFLDGNISPKLKKQLEKNGLDMNAIRQALVEETMMNAIPRIIAEGDIERLAALGELSGEKAEEIPANAKKITRERVIIELDD